jgi:hypothetical protein
MKYTVMPPEIVRCRLCRLFLSPESECETPDEGKTVFCRSCVEVILLGWLDSDDETPCIF